MPKTQNTNLSDENLSLDYLSFSLPKLKSQMREIAKIFHEYNINLTPYLTICIRKSI